MMKFSAKLSVLALLLVCVFTLDAHAMENETLKVGLKYGSDAQFTARLQNYNDEVRGSGYEFGYYDSEREFVALASTDEEKIAVTVDANAYVSGNVNYETKPSTYSTVLGGYHIELLTIFDSYEEALFVAESYPKGFVAYLDGEYRVRIGNHASAEESEGVLDELDVSFYGAHIVGPSKTGVVVSVTGTDRVLFEFDCSGLRSLGVRPRSVEGESTITWFDGFRYYGGFEYQRTTGGYISIINVINIEDYVKCVIAAEMSNDWPLEALKAQTVCARTYAATQTRHRASGFDVCSTTDCQAYRGTASCNEYSDMAAESTAGVYIYYNDSIITTAVYHSCNGGATEDNKNVWGGDVPYLKGKEDPFEADVAWRFSKYYWSFDVTANELSAILKARDVNIGAVTNIYVSEFTPMGNVYALTFEGTNGTHTVQRERCRTFLNGILDNVNVRSMRFDVTGGDTGTYYINDPDTSMTGTGNAYLIAGDGSVVRNAAAAKDTYVITADGIAPLQDEESARAIDTFTFTGTGWGHNIGMSQWGAYAMAERGYSYREILEFYYTDIYLS